MQCGFCTWELLGNIDLVRRSIVRYVTRKFSDAETAHVRDRRHIHIETYTFGATYRHSTRLGRTISRSVVVGWTRPKGREQVPISHLYTSSQRCLKTLSLSLCGVVCAWRVVWFADSLSLDVSTFGIVEQATWSTLRSFALTSCNTGPMPITH